MKNVFDEDFRKAVGSGRSMVHASEGLAIVVCLMNYTPGNSQLTTYKSLNC